MKSETSFNSKTGAAAGTKSKRGLGKKTVFKNLLEAAAEHDNQQCLINIYERAVTGEFGDDVQLEIVTQELQRQSDLANKKAMADYQYDLSKKERLYQVAAKALISTWNENQLSKFIEDEEC